MYTGVPIESLTSLSALLTPEVAEKVLDAFWQRDGETPGLFTIDLALRFLAIAKETKCLDDAACERLELAARVPHAPLAGILRRSRLFERALRLGVRYACAVGPGHYLVSEKNRLWRLDLSAGTLELEHVVRPGWKALCLNAIEGVDGFAVDPSWRVFLVPWSLTPKPYL